jgi:type II secretory pathway component PulF
VPALIAAGERGGELPQALEAAAQLIRRDLEIRAKVVAAISYPAFLCVAFAGALAMLILVVAPSLAPLMSEAGGSPPLVLTLLIGANAVLTQHGAAIGILLAATTAALALGARAKLFTAAWEVIVIDGPLHGVSRRLLYGQAATVIGRLMAAGAPAPEALRLGAAVVGNGLARRRLEGAAAAVFAGAPLSAALAGCQGFPPEVLRMAQLGEGAGELGAMLQNAGELAQAGALQWVDRLSKWLGPALIVGLGTMVGGMMASLLTALNTLGANALN